MPYCHFYNYATLMIRLDIKNEFLQTFKLIKSKLHVFTSSLFHFLVFVHFYTILTQHVNVIIVEV